MVEIYPQILNKIKTVIDTFADSDSGKQLLNNRKPIISPEYQREPQSFPYVTIEEINNSNNPKTELDLYETNSDISYEICIYDTATNKINVCRTLAQKIDLPMQREIGFRRAFMSAVPNILDATVYRIIIRYSGTLDNTTMVVYKNFQ